MTRSFRTRVEFFLLVSLIAPLVGCSSQPQRHLASDSGDFVPPKIMLITDMDDTIKVTHVRSTPSLIGTVFDTDDAFYGMSELYQAILKDQPGTPLYYVSNAPKPPIITSPHARFIRRNHFPKGKLILRESLSNKEHKQKTIRALLLGYSPEQVICIGDNGEQDAIVYQEMAEEFGDRIKFHTFIHRVYANDKTPELDPKIGQISYVTPLEIAMNLQREGVLKPETTASLFDSLGSRIFQEASPSAQVKGDRNAIPDWLDCRGFQWQWDDFISQMPAAAELKQKLNARCQSVTPHS